MMHERYLSLIKDSLSKDFVIDDDPSVMRKKQILFEHLLYQLQSMPKELAIAHLDGIYPKVIKRFFEKLSFKWDATTHCANVHWHNGRDRQYVIHIYQSDNLLSYPAVIVDKFQDENDAIERISDQMSTAFNEKYKRFDIVYFYYPPFLWYPLPFSGIDYSIACRLAGIKNDR